MQVLIPVAPQRAVALERGLPIGQLRALYKSLSLWLILLPDTTRLAGDLERSHAVSGAIREAPEDHPG